MAALGRCSPRDLDVEDLRTRLRADGALFEGLPEPLPERR